MDSLKINLENCYGINKLVHEFRFSESKVQLIYAPNGMMKSSLAQTFEDIAEGKVSMDRIFRDRPNSRAVTVDGSPILPEDIFVIQRMREPTFRDASTILANAALRERYLALNEKVLSSKTEFINILQPFFGIKANLVELELSTVFGMGVFELLRQFKDQIEEIADPVYQGVIYNEVFNDKVLKFLQGKNFNRKIAEYIGIYDDLVNKNESLFMKGTFNHYNADTVSKSLKENKFFAANHKVKIKDQEIDNIETLERLIAEERDKVLNNPDLKNKFDEIDKALNSNTELRKFRAFIDQNQQVLNELADVDGFRKKLILHYIAANRDTANHVLDIHDETEAERSAVIQEAKAEQEDWKNVLQVFNERFSVPFELIVGNQDDVILNEKAPVLVFRYRDSHGYMDLGGGELQTSLSTGELRVFYLLNIIFQFEVKRRSDRKQLVIVDDIADSFDYRNKYAIIQYLKDISEEENFFMLVLTHNFDFYRTFKSRLGDEINYQGNWMGIKGTTAATLRIGEKRDVFPQLRRKYAECNLSFIACIPFVRNLIEFTVGERDIRYLTLTSLLHMKPHRPEEGIAASADLGKGEIQSIFNSVFNLNPVCNDPGKKVFDLIMEQAAILFAHDEPDFTDLKVKLCLSLAIRLRAERFMIGKIQNVQFHDNILKKQTGKIVKQYRNEFPEDKAVLGMMDSVLLMTAENIHVNSFMYEPLMDLSIEHLKKLYGQIFSLQLN
ncbi:hypothetical protein ACTJKC_01920 [Pedobacter sp. 22226]|uniref:hypothetical protein n=1 Tax=Pedobacter sp. 22226 TaxID=3453894 RepID=UPI003F850441